MQSTAPQKHTLTELLEKLSLKIQASHWGWVELKTPPSIAIYEDWLRAGLHADMTYLQTQLPDKQNPKNLGEKLQSAFVFAFPYKPHPQASKIFESNESFKIAAYAQGLDYHDWLLNHLRDVIAQLKTLAPDEEFHCFTDSRPILERDLAARAGLGWIGKNSCLISPKFGSFFLIGEIFTSLPCEIVPELVHDFCGTCNKCIESCPTNAIKDNRTLDSNKCISYWNIESQKIPPPALREKFNSWFFGCDICQDVCPWNKKAIKTQIKIKSQNDNEARDDLNANNNLTVSNLRFILQSSNKELMRKLAAHPLSRSRGFGLKRNALIVIANSKLKELQPEVEALRDHSRLGELAQWCLEQIRN